MPETVDVTPETVASRNGRTERVRTPVQAADAAVTALLVRAIAERSLVWFVLIACTALAAYAVVATPLWWKLVGAGGYAVLIVMPVLRLAWRN